MKNKNVIFEKYARQFSKSSLQNISITFKQVLTSWIFKKKWTPIEYISQHLIYA